MSNNTRSDIGPFAIVPLWLIKSGISPGAIVTFALMWAKWADKRGECWPSHAKIAAELEASERTIIRHLAELEAIGAVDVVRRQRDDGSQTSNYYYLRSIQRGDKNVTGGGQELQGGSDESVTGGLSWVSDEPYPGEPDPEEPSSSSSASQPRDTIITDGEVVDDYDKSVDDADASVDGESGAASTTSDAPLSHPSPITPEVSEAMAILIEEGHDPKGVQAVLLSKYEGFGKGAADWTTHRGKSFPVEVLVDSVRLAVEFADACDGAGNKRPNPYTQKEVKPFRLLLTNDEKSLRHIRILIAWTFHDQFWSTNVLCAAKFRERWDQLIGARRRDAGKRQPKVSEPDGGEDWMARRKTG